MPQWEIQLRWYTFIRGDQRKYLAGVTFSSREGNSSMNKPLRISPKDSGSQVSEPINVLLREHTQNVVCCLGCCHEQLAAAEPLSVREQGAFAAEAPVTGAHLGKDPSGECRASALAYGTYAPLARCGSPTPARRRGRERGRRRRQRNARIRCSQISTLLAPWLIIQLSILYPPHPPPPLLLAVRCWFHYCHHSYLNPYIMMPACVCVPMHVCVYVGVWEYCVGWGGGGLEVKREGADLLKALACSALNWGPERLHRF